MAAILDKDISIRTLAVGKHVMMGIVIEVHRIPFILAATNGLG